jgi:hypothetical protein
MGPFSAVFMKMGFDNLAVLPHLHALGSYINPWDLIEPVLTQPAYFWPGLLLSYCRLPVA